ncbi:MAG: hypothetical protein ACRCYV_09170 [Aeromonas sp.]
MVRRAASLAALALLLSACDSPPTAAEIAAVWQPQWAMSGLFVAEQISVQAHAAEGDGRYRLQLRYVPRFAQSLSQLQSEHSDDVVFDGHGPYQRALTLMALESRYGAFEVGQMLPAQEVQVRVVRSDVGWQWLP